MATSIQSFDLTYHSYQLYDVVFYGERIKTLVTTTPCIIDTWISDIMRHHNRHRDHLIVGLDIEWRPNFIPGIPENPPATLQLCVGNNCIIIQLTHLPNPHQLPQSLLSFLNNEKCIFVGVGVDGDKEKLCNRYGVGEEMRTVDLRELAADVYGNGWDWLSGTGLKNLAWEVLRKVIQKPINVTLSNWDSLELNLGQIQYACVDAYVSFQIGKNLQA